MWNDSGRQRPAGDAQTAQKDYPAIFIEILLNSSLSHNMNFQGVWIVLGNRILTFAQTIISVTVRAIILAQHGARINLDITRRRR
jgi:hypothetical protein